MDVSLIFQLDNLYSPATKNNISQMASSLPDLNGFPVTRQSPIINLPGLDDFESNGSGFFETHKNTVNVDDEVEQAINIPELNQEPQILQLDTQGRKKELNNAERLAAYKCLLERIEDGILKRGSTRVVAAMFGVGIRSIQRLCKCARESGNHDHYTLRVRNCGQKRIEFDLVRIRDIPLRQRKTIKSLDFSLSVSRKFVLNKLKEGAIRRHTNSKRGFSFLTSLTLFAKLITLERSCSSDPVNPEIDSSSLTFTRELSSYPPISSIKLSFSSFSYVSSTISSDMPLSSFNTTISSSSTSTESLTTIFSEISNSK